MDIVGIASVSFRGSIVNTVVVLPTLVVNFTNYSYSYLLSHLTQATLHTPNLIWPFVNFPNYKYCT